MATKTKAKKKSKQAIINIQLRGLSGKGVLRLGGESRLELRDRLQMTRVVFGRVVNLAERTIAKVESKAQQVEKLRRPYNEVYRLHEALSEVIEPESLGAWFVTPNQAFDRLTPLEVIERGEIDRLWEMVYRLRSGMPG